MFIALLHFISIYYFTYKKNIRIALFFLFAGGLIARLVVISFDSYLHLWDEQYHALVAKNMVENPFVPMLFKYTPLDFDPINWTTSHIWLHKQPLFLWQMALSIKIFGASPFALRLPSAIMTSLLILVIFRMGKLTVNARIGYMAGFLFAVCNYLLDFNTGQYNTDHHDIASIFYISLSIWAYSEYQIEKKSRYVWLIGLFAGLAILNKWLVGLVVFSGWATALFFIQGMANKKSEIINMMKALIVCVLTFVPWQIYKTIRFPAESAAEYKYYGLHFTSPLDGHGGDVWYHFNQAVSQYGIVAALALPIALLVLYLDIKNVAIRVSYITYVVIVYLFFTITKTKMPAFCLVVAPILFLALGNFLNKIMGYLYRIKLEVMPEQALEVGTNSIQEKTKAKEFRINKYLLTTIEFLSLLIIGLVSFDVEKLQANHTDWIKDDLRAWCNKKITWATDFGKSIKGKYNEEKTVIVNCYETDNIPIMFFSGYTAYNRIPTPEEHARLKKNGYKILFIDDLSPIPEYLAADPNIYFINYIDHTSKTIRLKTINGKYVCADETINNLVFANRDIAAEWEIFSLILLGKNECAIRAYDKRFLSAELGQRDEITAIREKIGSWETFTLVRIDSNHVAFKAANGKYLSVDEKSLQLYAKGDVIGRQEIFELIENDNN